MATLRSEIMRRYHYYIQPGQDPPTDKEAMRIILRNRIGQKRAITSRQLAADLDLSTRQVRAIIAELVQDGELIGASVDSETGGYYLIENADELEQTRAILRARASEIFQRDRCLCDAWNKQHGGDLQPLLPTMDRRRDACPRSGER